MNIIEIASCVNETKTLKLDLNISIYTNLSIVFNDYLLYYFMFFANIS